MFKKRVPETKLEKTLTILDSETKEVKEIIDIIDEAKEITLVDEKPTTYSEMQLNDMSFMKSLRDKYPDMKDMESFLTDACASKKLIKDEALLSDEDKAAEKVKIDALATAEAKAIKLLKDEALKVEEAETVRQNEIEEAERARHAAAQKN